MQCEEDDGPGVQVMLGEQYPEYSTDFNSLSHLQGSPTEESMRVAFSLQLQEGSHMPPYFYGPISVPDSGHVSLEGDLPLPSSDFNLPPASYPGAFASDPAGGYPYEYDTPPQHINLMRYQYQNHGHPQDGSSAIQDLTHNPPHSRANAFLYHNDARTLPPAAMSSSPQLNTDAGTNSMVAHDTDTPEDVVPSVPSPHRMRDGEIAGPSAGPLPSDTSNAEPGDPKKKKRTTTKNERSKAKGNKNNEQQRLGPQVEGTIQVTAQSLPGRPDLQVVRQIAYRCPSTQKEYPKFGDINFSVNGKAGIGLQDAMNRYFSGPDGRDELMFTDKNIGISISFRIIFEGYRVWARAKQIATKNYRDDRTAITKKKLAEDVARRIKTYLEDLEDAKTPYPIALKDMVLVKLIQVAQSSWQAEIWYSSSASTSRCSSV